MGSQGVRHDLATEQQQIFELLCCTPKTSTKSQLSFNVKRTVLRNCYHCSDAYNICLIFRFVLVGEGQLHSMWNDNLEEKFTILIKLMILKFSEIFLNFF